MHLSKFCMYVCPNKLDVLSPHEGGLHKWFNIQLLAQGLTVGVHSKLRGLTPYHTTGY